MYRLKKCYEEHGVGSPEALACYAEVLGAEREKNADCDGQQLLFAAASAADAVALEFLFEQGLKPNILNSYGRTLLHYVAEITKSKGDETSPTAAIQETARLLVSKKVSPLRKDEDGVAPIHLAARFANLAFIEVLIESESNLSIADRNGQTALHILAEWGGREEESLESLQESMESRRLSAESNARPSYQRQYEEATLRYETRKAYVDNFFHCVVALLAADVEPDEKDNYNATPLDKGVQYGAKKICALLSGQIVPDESGDADPNAALLVQAGGMTVHQAIEKSDHDALKALIELGTDVNGEEGDNRSPFYELTPLATALVHFDLEAVGILLAAGADPKLVDTKGNRAAAYFFLTYATVRSHSGVLKDKLPQKIIAMLVQNGYDIDSAVNEQGQSLLTLAAKYAQTVPTSTACMQAALDKNADVNLCGLDGRTPLSFLAAHRFGSAEEENLCVSLLEEGADVTAADENGTTVLMYAAMNQNFAYAKSVATLLFDFGKPKLAAVNNDGKDATALAVENNNELLLNFLLKKL